MALLVFDSDPVLGMSINKGSDPIIGFALCPPEHDEPLNSDGTTKEPRSMKEYFVRSGLGEPEANPNPNPIPNPNPNPNPSPNPNPNLALTLTLTLT